MNSCGNQTDLLVRICQLEEENEMLRAQVIRNKEDHKVERERWAAVYKDISQMHKESELERIKNHKHLMKQIARTTAATSRILIAVQHEIKTLEDSRGMISKSTLSDTELDNDYQAIIDRSGVDFTNEQLHFMNLAVKQRKNIALLAPASSSPFSTDNAKPV